MASWRMVALPRANNGGIGGGGIGVGLYELTTQPMNGGGMGEGEGPYFHPNYPNNQTQQLPTVSHVIID
eukprot:CAMPEP_0175058122 /NCGR_PEP_ID=MMETSP0052_2-20121109/11664_1 /TAXON_ID=51329 ORGANISM="Polytomella parva, Strain SAG 63-3" /NCGR_SAMPLE_ID=MMETSP0052_2 /ASSEMBLY_ACC=CAM_ASM_000194 /LENGTH=68 /DNA_ID=CAMNT_0016323451 /DNA_START=164 /DNA_END=367 /DNA_ORIENTATION=-